MNYSEPWKSLPLWRPRYAPSHQDALPREDIQTDHVIDHGNQDQDL